MEQCTSRATRLARLPLPQARPLGKGSRTCATVAGLPYLWFGRKGRSAFLDFSFSVVARLSKLALKASKMTEAELRRFFKKKRLGAPKSLRTSLCNLSALVLCYRSSDFVLPLPSTFIVALPYQFHLRLNRPTWVLPLPLFSIYHSILV